MLDDTGIEGKTFDLAAFHHPLKRATVSRPVFAGMTITDIIRETDFPADIIPHLRVKVSIGTRTDEIPLSMWHRVKPRAGCMVEIHPTVEGPAIGAILTAVVGTAAPALAGSLFPSLAAGSIGLSLATAAITVVGTLLVRALIPPPDQPAGNDDPVFTLTGASNSASPYEPYPTVLGRHLMFPKKTATGYTETVEDEIYLRERMTFGYGPIALETLKIGTTPIWEFEGVEVEFLNVDKDLTLANMPELAEFISERQAEISEPQKAITDGQTFDITPDAATKQIVINVRAGVIGGGRAGDVTTMRAIIQSRVGSSGSWTTEKNLNVLTDEDDGEWESIEYTDGLQREFRVKANIQGDYFGGTLIVETVSVKYPPDVSTSAWRTGAETMTLYPDDIAEDTYSVVLEADDDVVRQTRLDTKSAQVDFSFQGLVVYDADSNKLDRSVDIDVEYRLVGDTAWVLHETKTCTENTTAYVRFTSEIEFAESGEYDIRVTRTTADSDDSTIRDVAQLTAIRSIQAGTLPSHENIAEVAVRIKASNELNGQIQNLNGIVQQLAPIWDGTEWTEPQAIRHPAWVFANALTGAQMRDPVDTDRLDLDELKAWADEEPHWTCDTVIEGTTRLADVLNLACAAGRARRGFKDLKFSVVRDGAAGGIVQYFTPRNSWGFVGRRFLDRDLHALRCRCTSERLEWQQGEVVVYADGHSAETATEIETMTLPGVVLTLDDDNEGNAWRLGRYHIAVAQLRPEEFSFYSSLDHLRCEMGDKVRVVHDVPMFGVGGGRVSSVTRNGSNEITQVVLDDIATNDQSTYRLRIRLQDGDEIAFAATNAGDGVWNSTAGAIAAVAVDDLVMVEETEEEPVDLLITSISHEGDLVGRITAVPAAPSVVTADTGTIPAYDPQITDKHLYGPPQPEVLLLRTGRGVALVNADKSLAPRAGVQISSEAHQSSGSTFYALRWNRVGSTRSEYSTRQEFKSEMFTGPLKAGLAYEVYVASYDEKGQSLGWVSAGQITPNTSDNVLVAPLLSAEAGVDYVHIVAPKLSAEDIMEYRVYAATDSSTDLTLVGQSATPDFNYLPGSSSDYTRYKMVAVDNQGNEGTYSAFVNVEPTKVRIADLASDALIDVTAAQQAVIDAEAAEAAAVIARTAAEDARDDAEAEALDAAVDAVAAEGHAIAAAADAAAALVSEGAAAAASSTAGASAAEAATQAGLAVSVVRSTLPEDFQDGGTYFTSVTRGDPATINDSPATQVEYVATTDGPLARFDLSTTDNKTLATKGVRSIQVGRDYRITVRARQSGAGPIRPFKLRARYLGDDLITSEGLLASTYSVAALDTWETFTFDFSPSDVAEIYCRPNVNYTYVASTAGYLEFLSLSIEDVTSEVEAETSAAASAASETAAGAHETAAGVEAAAAATDRLAAETARTGAEDAEADAIIAKNQAETARTQSVSARDDAEDAEAAASTSETNSAASESAAAGSASAAASDASVATTKAGEASTSAAAAAGSETSASTSAGTATTKAAEAAASATEADDAAVAAQTSEIATARLLSRGAAADPTFSQWPTGNTSPDHTDFGGVSGTATVVRETTGAKYTNAVRLSTGATPAGSNPFVGLRAGADGNFDMDPEDADLILVTAELELVSGAWGGARFRIQWGGSTDRNAYWYPIDTLSDTTGIIQKVEFTVERSDGYIAGSDNFVRLRFHGTSNGNGNTREVNEIICHSMDMQVATAESTAAITKAVKATTDGWSESYLGFQTAVVGAETVMSLYAFNDSGTPVSGVKIATGTFVIDADMTIFEGGIMASANYAETGGIPTAGFEINGTLGTIKAVGIIAREAMVPGTLRVIEEFTFGPITTVDGGLALVSSSTTVTVPDTTSQVKYTLVVKASHSETGVSGYSGNFHLNAGGNINSTSESAYVIIPIFKDPDFEATATAVYIDDSPAIGTLGAGYSVFNDCDIDVDWEATLYVEIYRV